MSAQPAQRLGWTACGVSLLCGAAAAALIVIHRSEPLNPWLDTSTQELVVGVSAFVGFGVFGALIVSRQPGNPIGWLFCAAALGASLGGLATQYAIEALVLDPGSLPAGTAMAWLGSWTWILFVPTRARSGCCCFPTAAFPRPAGVRRCGSRSPSTLRCWPGSGSPRGKSMASMSTIRAASRPKSWRRSERCFSSRWRSRSHR